MRRRISKAPRSTTTEVRLQTATYVRWSDGSWRRKWPKVKGKATVKAAKRARQRAMFAKAA